MGRGTYDFDIPNDPTEQLPFGIEWEVEATRPRRGHTSYTREFAPRYYPERFPQTKEKDLSRHGQQCGGEDISIKAVKNMEFHISGVVLADEVPDAKRLQDHEGVCDLYSPLSPTGGTECYLTKVEVDATPTGFDAVHRMWTFEYSMDLVSTGKDEYDRGTNGIVSAIL